MAEFKGVNFFLNIPASVAHDSRLNDKAKLLYGEIFSMVNVTGSFYMSNKALAERLNCSDRYIRILINELKELGLIDTKVEKDERGAIVRRLISIKSGSPIPGGDDPDFRGVMTPGSGGSCSPLPGGSDPQFHIIEHINRATNRTIEKTPLPPKGGERAEPVELPFGAPSADQKTQKATSEIEDSFEKLWKDYPRKAGKKQAFAHYKKWRKENKAHTAAYLAKRLGLYKAYLAANHTATRYILQGSTWFNGRFDDDYEIRSPEPKNMYDRHYE